MRACIVDNDKIFTYGFKKLTLIRGFFDEILDFDNGKDAIDFLKDPANTYRLPDVLFIDMNMPVMNGWEFNVAFEEIKSQLGKNIPRYNMSSSVYAQEINHMENNFPDADFLLKPIDEACLAAIVSSLQNPLIEMYI